MKWEQRWPSFKPEEVLSPDGLQQYKYGNLLLQTVALDRLQALRNDIDTPIIVNTGEHVHRGYRSPEENERIGGAKFSRHVQGIAFDISSSMNKWELADHAKRHGFTYIKMYKTWIHIDTGVRI